MQCTNHLLRDSHPDQEGAKGPLTGKCIFMSFFRLTQVNSGLKKAAEWLTFYEPDYPEGAFTKTLDDSKMVIRRATHAGSWYTSNGNELSRELNHWLQQAGPVEKPARAIIGPHAGYRYCGACAAHAYSQIDPTHVKRVFILGPSHHYRLNGCAVSNCTKYATPLYDLTVIDIILKEKIIASRIIC